MRASFAERFDSEVARILGNTGAKLGGYARAESMTAKQRSQSASKAAKSRWKNFRKEKLYVSAGIGTH